MSKDKAKGSKEYTEAEIKELGYVAVGMYEHLTVYSCHPDTAAVKGLSDRTGSISVTDTFGDSGDVFNHLMWRGLFSIMASTKAGMQFLIGLANLYLLRGASLKANHRGQVVSYSFNHSSLTAEERARNQYWVSNAVTTFKINFPTEASRVQAEALTPERLKCCLRLHIVPSLMKAKKFPAVSSANGYEKMCLTFQNLIDICGSIKTIIVELKKNGEPAAASIKRSLSKQEIDRWTAALEFAEKNTVDKYFVTSAMYAGCISSKEIYAYDEDVLPGTVFWSGIHAMMTDAANRWKASHQREDVRARFESSNFYDDFKRKMSARKMSMVGGKDYQQLLDSVANVIPIYILSTTSLKTLEEVNTIDNIMRTIGELQQSIETLHRPATTKEIPEPVDEIDDDAVKKAIEDRIKDKTIQIGGHGEIEPKVFEVAQP